MLLELAPEWTMDLDRGPDWLFIRLRPPAKNAGGTTTEVALAESIYQRLEQAFCHRLVLELDEVPHLRSWMLGELVRLHKRVASQGGTLRLCGLSAAGEEALQACGLFEHFPTFANRHDAVMGCNPRKPR
jgi:anti-anti-sigma factor